MDWHQLQVQIPYLGAQLAAWLYTDQLRAGALQQCPGIADWQPDWYQLEVQIPQLGAQQAAWLYTDQLRAGALQMALQTCPHAPYRILTQTGQPVVAQSYTPTLPTWPSWPPMAAA